MNYDIFVCYDTFTGGGFAKHVANCAEQRLGAHAFAAIRAGDIPPGYPDERKFRYEALRNSRYVLLLATNGIFGSIEVKNELEVALKDQAQIIVCPDSKLNRKDFGREFPDLKNTQTLQPWSDKFELAKIVVDWYQNVVPRAATGTGEAPESPANGQLIVRPRWSVEYVTDRDPDGQIIFEITNQTGQPVLLQGYRMFRVAPGGTKDFFYRGLSVTVDSYRIWAYSKHFQVLLMDQDKHVFNWGNVNIPETYGINHKGIWGTEIQIAYVRQDMGSPLVAVGKTNIEFK